MHEISSSHFASHSIATDMTLLGELATLLNKTNVDIRLFRDAHNKTYISIYETIEAFSFQSKSNSRVIWHRLGKRIPHVDVKFTVNGKLQARASPATDMDGITHLISKLNGSFADEVKGKALTLLKRYAGGDMSLATEIEENRNIQDALGENSPQHPMRIFDESSSSHTTIEPKRKKRKTNQQSSINEHMALQEKELNIMQKRIDVKNSALEHLNRAVDCFTKINQIDGHNQIKDNFVNFLLTNVTCTSEANPTQSPLSTSVSRTNAIENESEDLIDIHNFLQIHMKLNHDQIKEVSPLFGKFAKDAYVKVNKKQPETILRKINNVNMEVYVYGNKDIQMLSDAYNIFIEQQSHKT